MLDPSPEDDGTSPTVSTPHFVGRYRETAALRGALARPPAIVLVEGEAGIGKSRLLREWLAAPDQRTALVSVCPPLRESGVVRLLHPRDHIEDLSGFLGAYGGAERFGQAALPNRGRAGCLRVPSGWSELVLSLCSNPVMHVVVCGALVENGAVLLVHRSPTRRAYPDLWDLPGGHVEAGESELQALAREMHEELGVHIVAESSSRLGDLHAGSGEDAVHVGVWQIRDWVGSPTNRAPEEHDDIAWVGISELGGLPLVFGALPALLRSLPEPDRLPRRDEARTTASPSGP